MSVGELISRISVHVKKVAVLASWTAVSLIDLQTNTTPRELKVILIGLIVTSLVEMTCHSQDLLPLIALHSKPTRTSNVASFAPSFNDLFSTFFDMSHDFFTLFY